MDVLGQFHPQIVHTPVALLVFSAFFALVGRLFDREWVRKASVLLLVFGFLGAFAAVQSGQAAHRVPEHDQGVPEHEIDEHADAGRWVLWVSGAAIVAYAAAAKAPANAAGALSGLALVLQLMAAAAVGVTGFRGGELTYHYGANVRVGGQLVKSPAGAPADGVTPAAKPDDDADEKQRGD